MKKLLAAFAALFATVGAAQAQTTPAAAPSPVRFMLGMGLSGGGDKLASARYTDGTTVNINAGGLVYFTAGADYRITPEFSVQGTVNYHVDRANAKNGDIKFERLPVELLGYYQATPQWRVGGGVRYTGSPKLRSSGVAAGNDISFDGSVGAIVEGEYAINPKLGVKLRFVNETFKAAGYKDVNGSHVGVSMNYYF